MPPPRISKSSTITNRLVAAMSVATSQAIARSSRSTHSATSCRCTAFRCSAVSSVDASITRRTSSIRAVTRAVPSLSRYSFRFTIGSLPSQNRLTRSRVVTCGRGWLSSVAISPRVM